MSMFFPIVVLGTGFAIEIGFVYLVNKAMTKLLTDGPSLCCPKRKNPSVDIYTDRGGIAPVPEDDANDENEWNAQAEKQKLSETIRLLQDPSLKLDRMEMQEEEFRPRPNHKQMRYRKLPKSNFWAKNVYTITYATDPVVTVNVSSYVLSLFP